MNFITVGINKVIQHIDRYGKRMTLLIVERIVILIITIVIVIMHKGTGFKHYTKQRVTATASKRSQRC